MTLPHPCSEHFHFSLSWLNRSDYSFIIAAVYSKINKSFGKVLNIVAISFTRATMSFSSNITLRLSQQTAREGTNMLYTHEKTARSPWRRTSVSLGINSFDYCLLTRTLRFVQPFFSWILCIRNHVLAVTSSSWVVYSDKRTSQLFNSFAKKLY